LVIGGGSVERLGYLGIVQAALHAAGVETEVFAGIEPNPNCPTIAKAAAVGKAFGAQVVVPVGGGSAMDASKAIAGLIHTGETDVWPFTLGAAKAGQLAGSLPIAAVPTTAATASEVTPYAVISNYASNEKSVLAHEFFKPKAAWLNPAFTTEVNPVTTADGAADILSHVFENYLLGGNDSPMADGIAQTVMSTVLHALPGVLKEPKSLALRGQLLWASTVALNGYPMAGRNPSEFVLHSMEHALSGFMPALAHGRGLATLYPSYFRWLHQHDRGRERLAKLGRTLFGFAETDTEAGSMQFIDAFENWLRCTGLYQSLTKLGFQEAQYEAIAQYAVRIYGNGGQLNALGALPVAEIVAIFQGTHRQA
jgi:alcohol dehydrogenase YqhD (iron-dependent ADH family)